MLLHRMQDRGQPITVQLVMNARTLPDRAVAQRRGRAARAREARRSGRDRRAHRLVGRRPGRDGRRRRRGRRVGGAAPDEVARPPPAAHDPRRRLDERGERRRGGRAYRATHAADVDKHVFALESDNGVFRPFGIAVAGTDSAIAMLRAHRAAALAHRRRLGDARRGRGRRRAAARARACRAPACTSTARATSGTTTPNADTPDKLDPARRRPCVATMAVYAYVVAEMPETLPRSDSDVLSE